MKMTFEFQEQVTYMHSIDVEIPEDKKEEYEEFADDMAEKISGIILTLIKTELYMSLTRNLVEIMLSSVKMAVPIRNLRLYRYLGD